MKKNNNFLHSITVTIILVLLSLSNNKLMAQEEEIRTVGKFESIKLFINADVYISQNNETTLKLEGQPKILNEIETVIDGITLKIRFKDNWSKWKNINKKTKIYLSSPTIKNLQISGSGTIRAKTPIKTDYVDYAISGSGKIVIDDLTAKNVGCKISGSGDIILKGNKVDELEIAVSGSGNINTTNMEANEVNVSISGSGDCRINVTEKLEAKTSGSGDIYYKGNPKILDARTFGSGRINSISE